MTPLGIFLLGLATIYLGTVQAAFSAMMRLSLRIMAERAGRSDALAAYLEDPARLFVPVRLLLATCTILLAALLARAIGVTTLHGVATLVASLALFVIVCEHILPSLIVRKAPQRVLEVLLPSFGWVSAPLVPLTRALGVLWQADDRLAATDDGTPADAPSDAAGAAASAVDETRDRDLLRSIVGFRDRLVREVMTPRPDIVAIEGSATLADLRAFVREQEYSRIPVYSGDLDNVLGFVFVKDLITRDDLPPTAPVTALMRRAYIVPETKRVPELLKEFQRERLQTAIVVDEYGGVAGLVTLEDLIEELVGEIQDEYDVETEPISREGDDVFVISGRVDVDEVAERLGVAIEGEGFETFGGYLLSRLGRVPQPGERFTVDALEVEVLEADRRRLLRARVRRREPAHEGT